MGRKGKIILASIAGAVVAVFAAAQIVLNSKVVTDLVDKIAAENLDADLAYSKIRISIFPKISVRIDSLSLTYPHDRFAQFDSATVRTRLLDAGRGESVDTLAAFDRLFVSVNPWQLLTGRIRLSEASIRGLAAYAHQYDSTSANWNIFRASSDKQKDTTASKPLKLPWISVGKVALEDRPHVVYTNQADTVFAAIRFDDFALGADVKLNGDNFKINHASVNLDSLSVIGRLPADTLSVKMDYLTLSEPKHHVFDFGLGAQALVLTSAFGRLQVPVTLDGRVGFDKTSERLKVEAQHFDANLAYIPFRGEGEASLYGDRTDIDASISVVECPLDTILRQYADNFIAVSRDISTDGKLTVEVSAEGTLSKDTLPHVEVCVQVPDTHISYAPMDLTAFLNLDVDADVSPSKNISADIHEFVARIPGVSLEFDGSAEDILGRDPLYQVAAVGYAKVDSIKRFIPESVGLGEASGRLDVDLYAKVNQSELNTYKFRNAVIRSCIKADELKVSMPKDSLFADVFKADVDVNSIPTGLDVQVAFDSVYFNRGVTLIARVRDMLNSAEVSKVENNGKYVPRLAVATRNGVVFVKNGSSRFGIKGMDVALSAKKRVIPKDDRRRHLIDSLQRVYPGTPRNELIPKMLENDPNHPVPSFLSEKDFAKSDITFSLDSTITKYLREWSPEGKIKAAQGFMASPRLPLRTRLTAMDLSFDENQIQVDTLSVSSGTSDISLKGYVEGALRSLVHKSRITTRLNISSNRLNVNEITAALGDGKSDVGNVSVDKEEDESFVTDKYADSNKLTAVDMPLMVVPANVDADVDIDFRNINFAALLINPMTACLKMKERTAQIVDFSAATSAGNALVNAFYSTQTKKDISAGVDVKLSDVSAYDIIHLLPSVDSLMPALKSFEGKFNADLSATTQLDTNMNVVIPSLDGMMRISGTDLMVKDAGNLKKITRLLLFKDKNIGHIDDLNVNAVIHDSKVEVFPFELGVDRYKLALRGMQGLDKSMFYHLSVLKSPFLLRFGVNIFGTLDNWRFSLGFAKYREGKVPSYSKELDAVQINILKSIRNIYEKGAADVRAYNANSIKDIQSYKDKTDTGGKMTTNLALSAEEMAESDNLSLELELMSQEEDIQAEVDDALESTFVDAGKLMQSYESQTYSKSMTRQMERLKAESEKKAARKAARKSKS